MEKYDLHIHSIYSDGVLSPKEIAEEAARQGLAAFSLTDHDEIGGVKEAQEAAKELGIKCIAGIELSAYDGQEIHVLGYNVSPNAEFLSELERLQLLRKERNYEIIRKLHAHGVKLKVYDEFENGSKGRALIAKMLYEQGFVRTRGEAFDKYIGSNSPCYVGKMRISPEDAIKLITNAGGSAVLAHPYKYYKDGILDDLVKRLSKVGLSGIEVYYSKYGAEVRSALRQLAAKYDLFCTGGSDHHSQLDSAPIGGVKVILNDKAKKGLKLI